MHQIKQKLRNKLGFNFDNTKILGKQALDDTHKETQTVKTTSLQPPNYRQFTVFYFNFVMVFRCTLVSRLSRINNFRSLKHYQSYVNCCYISTLGEREFGHLLLIFRLNDVNISCTGHHMLLSLKLLFIRF